MTACGHLVATMVIVVDGLIVVPASASAHAGEDHAMSAAEAGGGLGLVAVMLIVGAFYWLCNRHKSQVLNSDNAQSFQPPAASGSSLPRVSEDTKRRLLGPSPKVHDGRRHAP